MTRPSGGTEHSSDSVLKGLVPDHDQFGSIERIAVENTDYKYVTSAQTKHVPLLFGAESQHFYALAFAKNRHNYGSLRRRYVIYLFILYLCTSLMDMTGWSSMDHSAISGGKENCYGVTLTKRKKIAFVVRRTSCRLVICALI